MRFSNLIFVATFLSSDCFASRIDSTQFNLGKVDQIFVGPGLVSVVEFPEDVLEARNGAPHIFKVMVSPANPKELVINVAETQPFQTNLIVRTVRRTFVFDLVPSLSKHQDYLQIKGAFGSASQRDAEVEEVVTLKTEKKARAKEKVLEQAVLK